MSFFLEHGWKWSGDLLDDVVSWLQEQDVPHVSSLKGVIASELDRFDEWPKEVLSVDVRGRLCTSRVAATGAAVYETCFECGTERK